MDLFKELLTVIKELKGKKYLLTGGLAYALYVRPRFTQDIDFVIAEDDFEEIQHRLNRLGFLPQPNLMVFKKAKIGRCTRVKGDDRLMVNFLLQPKKRFDRFYQRAQLISHQRIKIKVISLKDLVWLKRARHSPQDRLDIQQLLKTARGGSSSEK